MAGPAALTESARWIDRVQAATHVSLLAGRRWLEAWSRAFPAWEPWVLTLLDDEEPIAVAPLARRRTRWGVEAVSMGAGEANESVLAARGELGSEALAASIAHGLGGLQSRWSLHLFQLPPQASLTHALLDQLQPSRVWPSAPRPVLWLGADPDRHPERILTRNTRAAVAKARNRIAREGRGLRVGWVDDWREIQQAMSEVAFVHRARDLELRGMSLLDEPAEAAFYEQVLVRHAGEWRLLAVRIDERLAGYAMCLVDGATLRVWDNRVAPEFRRYSAGLVANAEVVLSAARDRGVHDVDWGCGLQRYKTSMSNRVVEGRNLVAWSSTLLRASHGLARRIPRPSRRARDT